MNDRRSRKIEKRKLKSVINTPLYRLATMSYDELREYQSIAGKEVKKRVKAFEKGKLEKGIPDEIEKLKRGTTKKSMINFIATSSQWLNKSASLTSNYRRMRRERRKAIEGYLDKPFKNYEEYEQFAEFMGDMQQRAGEQWDKISGAGIALYEQARRLNIDTDMLVENYDYWLSHIKKMKKVDGKKLDEVKKKMKKANDEEDIIEILGFSSVNSFYKELDGKRSNGKRGKR